MDRTRSTRLSGRFLTLALSFAVVGVTACGDEDTEDHDHDHDHDHDGDGLAGTLSHMCEHFVNGPFESLAANLDQEMAPSATFEHTRVNLALAATEGGNGGWVHFDSPEAGEYVFGVSADVDLMIVRHQDDSTVTPERSLTDTDCADMAEAHVVDLEAGRYDLWFGPTNLTEVGWGYEAMEHHDHDHDGG